MPPNKITSEKITMPQSYSYNAAISNSFGPTSLPVNIVAKSVIASNDDQKIQNETFREITPEYPATHSNTLMSFFSR